MGEAIAYKPADAAKMIGVSLPTMYNFVHREIHPCPSFRVGLDGRQIRIPRIGLEMWVLQECGVDISKAADYLAVREAVKNEQS